MEYSKLFDQIFDNAELLDDAFKLEYGYMKKVFKHNSYEYFTKKIISIMVNAYSKTNNPILLIIDKIFLLFSKISEAPDQCFDFILESLGSEFNVHCYHCEKCNVPYSTTISNYDELCDLELKTDCEYYNRFTHIIMNLIQIINNYIESNKITVFTTPYLRPSNLFHYVSRFNNIYLFSLFAINLHNELKQNPFEITINDKCVIVLLQQGYLVVGALKYFKTDYFDYIIKYLRKCYGNTKNVNYQMYLASEIILLHAITSNKKDLCEYLLDNNFFDIECNILTNARYSRNGIIYTGLIEIICRMLKIVENVYIDIVLKYIHSILDNFDLNHENACMVICDINFKNVPVFLIEGLINKIKYYDQISKFHPVIIRWIQFKLQIEFDDDRTKIDIDEVNDIKNLDQVIQNIKTRTYFINANNKKKIRYINNIYLYTNAELSNGRGVLKATMKLLVEKLLNEISLDHNGHASQNVIKLDNYDINSWFNYFGLIHAYNLNIYNINVIPIYIYKFMFGLEIKIEDVCDQEFINNLNTLKNLTSEELDSLMLTHNIIVTKNNNATYFDLIPNGNNIKVTQDNVKEYINLMKKYYMFKYPTSPRYLNMTEFTNGFCQLYYDITKLDNSMDIYEMLILLNKRPKITREELNNVLSCDNKILYEWLINYLMNLNEFKLQRFFEFVTCVNYWDYANKIQVYAIGSCNRFPIARTCRRALDIPLYKNYDVFEERMNIALDNFIGFHYA